MKLNLALAPTAIALAVLAGAADAQVSRQSSTNCDGGSCSTSSATTGPGGRMVRRDSAITCADGSCYREGVYVGPQGNSMTHTGTIYCINGACYRDGVYIGPGGNSASYSGTATSTAPGQVDGQTTLTGPGGQTRTIKRSWLRVVE